MRGRPEKIKTKLGQRLRDIRTALEKTDRVQFAETLGVSNSGLAAYERGDNKPNTDVLQRYYNLYKVDINWLVSGEGKMFRTEKDLQEQQTTSTPIYPFSDMDQTKIQDEPVSMFKALYISATDTVDTQIRNSGIVVTVEERTKRILSEFERIKSLYKDNLITELDLDDEKRLQD